ncbi:hypothetical protein [Robertkochia flava]|nr:hypothetical protein [Robertkochia marina]
MKILNSGFAFLLKDGIVGQEPGVIKRWVDYFSDAASRCLEDYV